MTITWMGVFSHPAEVFTIVFGITSGILTLVGLIALFITLNSQHNIERGREILWDLMALPYQKIIGNGIYSYEKLLEQEIINKFSLYNKITRSGKFVKQVVRFVISTIIFVCIVWTGVLIGFSPDLSSQKFGLVSENILVWLSFGVGVILLILFVLLLRQLMEVKKIGELPSFEEVMDLGSKKSEIPTLVLLAMTMSVVQTRGQIFVRFAFPVQGLTIRLSGTKGIFGTEDTLGTTQYIQSLEQCLEVYPLEPLSFLLCVDSKTPQFLTQDGWLIPLVSGTVNEELCEELDMVFQLYSEQGMVTVHLNYESNKIEEEWESRSNSPYLIELLPRIILPDLIKEYEMFQHHPSYESFIKDHKKKIEGIKQRITEPPNYFNRKRRTQSTQEQIIKRNN